MPRDSRDATRVRGAVPGAVLSPGIALGMHGSGAIAQQAAWWGAEGCRSALRRREKVELLHLQRGQGLPA